jgi:hypothetical protein
MRMTNSMSDSVRSLRVFAVLCALILCAPASAFAGIVPVDRDNPLFRQQNGLPLEYEDDPPMDLPVSGLQTTRAAASITFGPYTSYQVNVNVLGNDILGDAANEPSIAVHPFNHNLMCIGWRQFANVASNFREAGFGYTTNGGLSWTASKLQAGTFRSDPVLSVDSGGDFFYNSLVQTLTTNVFTSTNAGATWAANPVYSYGGDKQWMTIDRSIDNFYQAWSIASNPFAPNTFNKSPNGGASWDIPSSIPNSPIWGTLDVANDHTLYVGGWATNGGQLTSMAVSRSTDAHINDATPPVFTTVNVDLGGFLNTGGPNPQGLLGQVWCEVDKSNGPRSGWVYLLASVNTPSDPMDVMFIRSTDGGQTWTAPKRVNDDVTGNNAWQWFGTMSVAPSGRIDAVWNDTRGSADMNISALYYSYSTDGGNTWAPNVQVTPTWSSIVGWPNQQKIGDYYDTVSDDTGVDVAYAATFTGGQNVYYLRIPNTATQTGVPPSQSSTTLRLGNSPNPFSRGTTIQFDAPASGGHVRVEVFDLAGHRVATLVDGFRAGPSQSIGWDGRRADGSDAGPGVYLCRLTANGATEARKILRVR